MSEPFFTATGPIGEKRFLLISYHFPPSHATGALRWQKLATFAAQVGWQLDVVTLHPEDIKSPDWGRMDQLPAGTRVYGARRRPPRIEQVIDAVRAPLRRWARKSVTAESRPVAAAGQAGEALGGMIALADLPRAFPGPRAALYASRAWRHLNQDSGWMRNAVNVGLSLARSTSYDAVISCGPPHAAHEAARIVSRRARVPLVIDLRDPWGQTGLVDRYCASPAYFRILRGREARAVAAASLVVVNTETHLSALRRSYPNAAQRMMCVLNGCDEERVQAAHPHTRFTIAYAGNIYFDRDPRPLFAAAARVIRARALTPDQFAIELLGDVQNFAGRSVSELAAEAGIEGYVHVYPRRMRAGALQFMANADMLLSLPQSAPLCIPSKLYEYMQFEAWILALAERGCAAELLLRDTGADVAAPDDEAAITNILDRRYAEFAAGARPPRLIDRNQHLTRRLQARALFDAVAHMVAGVAVPVKVPDPTAAPVASA